MLCALSLDLQIPRTGTWSVHDRGLINTGRENVWYVLTSHEFDKKWHWHLNIHSTAKCGGGAVMPPLPPNFFVTMSYEGVWHLNNKILRNSNSLLKWCSSKNTLLWPPPHIVGSVTQHTHVQVCWWCHKYANAKCASQLFLRVCTLVLMGWLHGGSHMTCICAHVVCKCVSSGKIVHFLLAAWCAAEYTHAFKCE